MKYIGVYSLSPASSPATASPSASTSAATTSTTSASQSTSSRGILLWFLFGSIVNEQLVEIEAVGEDHVSNVISANADAFHGYRVLVLQLQFHLFQMCIHRHVHS